MKRDQLPDDLRNYTGGPQALRVAASEIQARMGKLNRENPGGRWTPEHQVEWDRDLLRLDEIHTAIRNIAGEQELFGGGSRRGAASPEIWTTPEGRQIRVLGAQERLADLNDGAPRVSFGLGQYIRAMVSGTQNPDIRAALSEGTDSAGGFTVPITLLRDLIDRMRARMVCIRAGARTVPLDALQTNIARLATDATATWRNENAAINESDPTFERVQFIARSLAVLVKVSRELLDDSANLDEALPRALADALAVELDRVCLMGSGTAPEPRGIFNQTGIGSVSMGTNGAALTGYGKVLDTLLELVQDNAETATGMVMAPRTWRTIEGFVDTTNQPLMPPRAVAEVPQFVTNSIPINQTQGSASNASPIIVGNFADLLMGVRQDVRVEVLRERYAEVHQYAFVCHLRADVAVSHPESFAKLIGIIP